MVALPAYCGGCEAELAQQLGRVLDNGELPDPTALRRLLVDEAQNPHGATWLDGQIVNPSPSRVAGNGFGAEVLDALEQRKDELVRRGHAWRTSAGEFRARANLIGTLRRQEVERVGRQLATERGLELMSVEEGEMVRGKLLGSVHLASERFRDD